LAVGRVAVWNLLLAARDGFLNLVLAEIWEDLEQEEGHEGNLQVKKSTKFIREDGYTLIKISSSYSFDKY
jgi:small nuclear ribonucleoprotein (snRNP)-like protein